VNVKETDRYRDRFRIPMPIATELGRLPLGGFPRAPALWVENHYEVTKVAHDDSISAGIDSRKLQSHSEYGLHFAIWTGHSHQPVIAQVIGA